LNTDFEREWSYKHHLKISTELCYVEILDEITLSLGQAILEELNNNLCDKREFIKVGNCCTMTYGDSGCAVIKYPLYFSKNVKVENRKSFKEMRLKLGDYRNDWNPKSSVQDIIDPERYPVYFKTKNDLTALPIETIGYEVYDKDPSK
jgi:hypothetical protein